MLKAVWVPIRSHYELQKELAYLEIRQLGMMTVNTFSYPVPSLHSFFIPFFFASGMIGLQHLFHNLQHFTQKFIVLLVF